MATDLHQHRPRRRSLLAAGLAACVGVCEIGLAPGALPARADDPVEAIDAGTPRAPSPCAIDGRASVPGLEITRRSHHGRTTVARLDVPVRELRMEVLAPASFHVWTREGEPALEGHTERAPPISLRSELTLGGVIARRGAPVTRLTPREQSLDVDVDLGEGVTLRRIFARCETLRIRESAPAGSVATSALRPPLHQARGRELSLRASPQEGLETARLAVPAGLRLEERGRNDEFLHLRRELPYGTIDGWVRDTTVVPAR